LSKGRAGPARIIVARPAFLHHIRTLRRSAATTWRTGRRAKPMRSVRPISAGAAGLLRRRARPRNTFEFSAGFASDYIYRGTTMTDHKPVVGAAFEAALVAVAAMALAACCCFDLRMSPGKAPGAPPHRNACTASVGRLRAHSGGPSLIVGFHVDDDRLAFVRLHGRT
jgi:hypothetical protein